MLPQVRLPNYGIKIELSPDIAEGEFYTDKQKLSLNGQDMSISDWIDANEGSQSNRANILGNKVEGLNANVTD